MTRYDIIGALRTYATNLTDNRGWVFCAGQNWVHNYHANTFEFSNGQILLACMFTCKPTIERGIVQTVSYDGIIFMGRKFDSDGTPCSLSETFIQKYDNRLLDLIDLLVDTITDFACENNLTVEVKDIPYELDSFDTDIDMVAANVIFYGE